MSDRSAQISYLQRLIDRMTGRSDSSRSESGTGAAQPPFPETRRPSSGQPPTPHRRSPEPPAKSKSVSWGNGTATTSHLDDPLHFIGQIDPLEGTALAAGEMISVCTRCGAGYHLSTMTFIRGTTGGACISCSTAGMFRTLLLVAGTATATPTETIPPPPPPIETKPRPAPVTAAPPRDAAGRPIIQLHQVRDYIGEEIAFEGRILRVHLTGGGAYFLYFERAARVLDGFRAVIRPRDIFHWEIEGIVPPEAYPDQWVRIVGKIVDDPKWQLEMLIQRPESIQIISGPTESTGWRPASGVMPEIPVIEPSPRTAATEAKRENPQRIRWLG